MTFSHEYAVSLQIAAPRTIAAVHARLPIGAVPRMFRVYLHQVYAAARSGVIQLDGQNVFVYRDAPNQRAEADVAFGGGVTTSFPAVGWPASDRMPNTR